MKPLALVAVLLLTACATPYVPSFADVLDTECEEDAL